MEIIQTSNTLAIFGSVVTGYSNIYILQKIDPLTTLPTNIAVSVSTGGTSFNLPSDGYYAVNKFTLSTDTNSLGYYIVGQAVYVPGGTTWIQSALYNLLTVSNPSTVGITLEVTYYFTYYAIQTYYLNLLKAKFLKDLCSCGCDSNDKVLIDTFTMGIEVLKNLIQYSQYNEASRIVSILSTCSGVVNTSCNCYG